MVCKSIRIEVIKMIWNCEVCYQIHDSNEVGFKCPNRNKFKYKTEHQKEIQRFYGSTRWSKLRSAIVTRDKCCMRCLSLRDLYVVDKLEVHHIKPIELYWEERFNPSNLVTLCVQCHRYVDNANNGELDFEFTPPRVRYTIK